MIDKGFIERIFEALTVDEALRELFENYGPCLRSEYTLEKENLLDLDWEKLGLVVTLIDSKLSQLYLSINEASVHAYEGWMGEGVNTLSSQNDAVFKNIIENKSFKIEYQFSEDTSIQSAVISGK